MNPLTGDLNVNCGAAEGHNYWAEGFMVTVEFDTERLSKYFDSDPYALLYAF